MTKPKDTKELRDMFAELHRTMQGPLDTWVDAELQSLPSELWADLVSKGVPPREADAIRENVTTALRRIEDGIYAAFHAAMGGESAMQWAEKQTNIVKHAPEKGFVIN